MWNLRNNRCRKATVLTALVLAAFSVILIMFLHPPKTETTIELFTDTGHIPNAPFSPFNYLPQTWGWAWKTKEKLLGHAKSIELHETGWLLGKDAVALIEGVIGRPSDARNGRYRAWFLGTDIRKNLNKAAFGDKSIFSGNMRTAEHCESCMFVGKTWLGPSGKIEQGHSFRAYPRLQEKVVLVFAEFRDVEAVTNEAGIVSMTTNLLLSARIPFTAAKETLILAPYNNGGTNSTVGIIVSAWAK